jgi:glycosyltransferase involved in cell wall biosynthesis
MAELDLSVIVPFWSAEEHIGRCIEGILAQNYRADRFEIIAIDNNSPDTSAEIVRRYPRVKLLNESMQGAYAARNRGVNEARGAILAFTDPDCIPYPDWLSRIAHGMRDPAVQVIVGPSLPGGNSRSLKLLGAYEQEKEAYILSSDDPTLYWAHANNMAIRKNAWREFGPFIERARGSDVIFARRVVNGVGCSAVRYEPEAQVKHLELANVFVYFRKVFIYGRSHQQYGLVMSSRSLATPERIAILRRLIEGHRLSTIHSALLILLLATGVCFWYAGDLIGMLGGVWLKTSRRFARREA